MSQWVARAGVMAVALLTDLATGAWARSALAHGRTLSFLHGGIRFQLLYNRGAMLGLGSSHPGWVTALGVLGTLVIGVLAFRAKRGGLPVALMTGGALGNVLSRLISHRVTDFIHVMRYPGIFNLSDVALRVGVVWFIVVLVQTGRPRSESRARQS